MHLANFLLADSVQVCNNKLYVLGGGWVQLHLPAYPMMVGIGVALGVVTSWSELARPHRIVLTVQDEDGERLPGFEVVMTLEPHLSEHLPPGSEHLTNLALGLVLPLLRPGTYEFLVHIDGEGVGGITFHAMGGVPV